MYQHFFRHGAGFNDGAVRGQVAFQDSDAAGSAVGFFAAVDYVRTADFRVFDQSADGLTGNGLAGFDDEPFLCQFMHNRADAAGFVQVRHMMGAAGAQESQVGGLLGNFIEQFQGQLDAGFMGNGGEVQRRVGAAADSHVYGNGIFERIHGYDISREHLFFDHADNGFTAFFGQTGAVPLISGGNRSVARHSQTQYFREAVHGVGCKQAGAAAAAGAGGLFHAGQFFFIDFAGFETAGCFKRSGNTDIFPVQASGKHGTAAAYYGRDVQTQCCHQHAGNNLVAVGDQYHAIKRMAVDYGFNAVGD